MSTRRYSFVAPAGDGAAKRPGDPILAGKPERRQLRRAHALVAWVMERGGLSFGVGVVAIVVCLLFLRTGAGRTWEAQTLDWRFQQRGSRLTSAPIVIVAVDDATEERWPEPTLFWGTRYARVVRTVRTAGAKHVALDVVFAVDTDTYLDGLGVPQETRPNADLARALLDAKGGIALASLLGPRNEARFPIARFWSLPGVMENIGFINLLPDRDGVIRAMPLCAADARDRRAGLLRPAFAAQAAARFRNGDLRSARDAVRLFPRAAAPRVNSGLWTRFAVNYTGARFPTLPAWRVAANQLTAPERAQLRGALVFVGGATTTGADRFPTPFGGGTEGVVLHAEAAATLLDDCALRFWSPAQNAGLCAVVGLCVLLAGARLPVRVELLVAVLTTLAAVVVSQGAFARRDLVLPLGGMCLCALLPCGLQQAACVIEERVRRQQLRRLLGRWVSPPVRDYLLHSPERLRMEGVERNAVILFFDIRGSLTFAETRTPTETLHELNAFFTRVVPVLEAHHGLLYRYTGDGFLAVFGAPDPLPAAADCAVRAALGLIAAVADVNDARRADNKPPLPVGCGLHGGTIICGNLGVAARSDFTVIGDVVNRAARLESCNKTLNSEIVVSRAVWDALPAPKPTGFVGPARVVIAGSLRPEDAYYRPAAPGPLSPVTTPPAK